jgi:hypothetical protein
LRTPPLTRGSRTRSSGSREATGEFRVHARPDETRRDETKDGGSVQQIKFQFSGKQRKNLP